MSIIIALMIVGAVVLIASIWAWRRNDRWVLSEMPRFWQMLWRFRWRFGVILGVASYFMHYPLQHGDDIYTVYGVPFMAYAFDQRGYDYVGALTMPSLVLNFIVWLYLPQLCFWLAARMSKTKRISDNA